MFSNLFNNNPPEVSALERDIERLFIAQDIIKAVAEKKTFEEVAIQTLNEIESKMGYIGASISLINEESNTIELKYVSNSFLSTISKKLHLLDPESFKPIPFRDNNLTYTKLAAIENRIIIDADVSKFTVPPMTPSRAKLVQKFSFSKCMVAVPIRTKDKVIGVLNFVLRKEKEEISDNELKTLELFIDQIGLIIDNILKYERIENFNEELTQKIDDATSSLVRQNKDLSSLYNLSTRVSETLIPQKVMQAAVDAMPQDEFMIGATLATIDYATNTMVTKVVSTNNLSAAVQKLIGGFEKYTVNLSDPQFANLASVQAAKSKVPIFSTNLMDVLSPPVPKTLIKPIEKILNIQSVASYPLVVRNNVIGVMGYFIKGRSVEEIDTNFQQLMQTYTTQIAISLENALLFENSQMIQKNLEQALNDLKESRRREQDMIDIMGHELRTPMTIIRNTFSTMNLQMQAKGEIPKEKQRKYIDIGLENSRRESNLIETLLSATKADSKGFQLTFEKIDLKDVIEDSLLAVKSEVERKKLELIINLPEKPVFIYCDRTRIQEISDNLIGNAVKYTPKGFVKITATEEGDYGKVAIEDSGFGISKEDLENLGKKFYRAKNYGNPVDKDGVQVVRPGGTGLGLYVSFALIKLMDGQYNVSSELGKGSIFSFNLPIFKGQEIKQVERKLDEYMKK